MKVASSRRTFRLTVAAIAALVFSASAYAYVCHPDVPGTRTLAVNGRVDGYALSGRAVTVQARVGGCERQIVWRPLLSTSSAGPCVSSVSGTAARRSASDGRHRVVLVRGSKTPDQPDRLAVYDARTGNGLHAWPLPAAASSIDVARGLAVVSTANGVYVVRLRDGRFALVGVKRPRDRPQIDAAGLVFQDDLYKRRSARRSLLKFLPTATLTHTLRPFGPLRVPFRIGDIAVDGRSVVFVQKDPTGDCDRIGVWTIPWHYSTDLMDEPPICPERHAPGGITGIALGGQFVEVLTTYGKVQTLISSTFVHCIEKVVTRTPLGAGAISALAGDSLTLAYAFRPRSGAVRIGRLHGQRPAGVNDLPSAIRLSVDGGRLAVLRADGRIDVLSGDRTLRTFGPLSARAIALRGDQLVVLTRAGTLDVYAVSGGTLLHRWRAPAGATAAVDVHYGVAVLTAGSRVYAIGLESGKQRVLLAAPGAVRAYLDDIGVVYAYNAGRNGVLGFIPFAAVERASRPEPDAPDYPSRVPTYQTRGEVPRKRELHAGAKLKSGTR